MKKLLLPWLFFLLLLLIIAILPSTIAVSTVTRSFFPVAAGPADIITVRLMVDEDGAAPENMLLIEEHVPLGWTVVDRKHGKGSGARIAWAFIEGLGGIVEDTELSYTIRVPSHGTGVFNGSYVFGSNTVETIIRGDTSFTVRMQGAEQPVPKVVEQPSAPEPALEEMLPPPAISILYEPPAPIPVSVSPTMPQLVPLSAPVSEPFVSSSPKPAFDGAESESVPEDVVPPPLAPPVPEEVSGGVSEEVSDVVSSASPSPTIETTAGAEPLAASPDVFVPETATPAEQPAQQPAPFPPNVSAPSQKSSWWLILLGVGALGGLIAGGIYLKHHPLHNTAVGAGESFSPQTVKYYIDQYAKLGYQKEQIIAHLVKNGMPPQLVEQVYAEMEQPMVKAG